MELCGEPRVPLVPDALVGAIVHIDEERFPVCRQRAVVHRIAVVLRGDEAALRTHHPYRLVMAAVTVLQLIDLRPACLAQQLVSHADAEDRQFLIRHCLADVLHGGIADIGVARALLMKSPSNAKPL